MNGLLKTMNNASTSIEARIWSMYNFVGKGVLWFFLLQVYKMTTKSHRSVQSFLKWTNMIITLCWAQ